MDVIIRPLTPADRSAFRALRRRALSTDPDAFLMTLAEEDAVERLLLENLLDQPTPANCLMAAERDGQLIGVVGLANRSVVKIRHVAHLVSVYVAPEARRHGIARRLIEAAIARAFAQPQIEAVVLDVVAGQPAEALYRRLGFREFGREPDAHYFDNKRFDLLHMRLARPAR